MQERATTGEDLLRVLAALASPHRLRILARLAGEPVHVSQLAREIGLSRPLVHMHLKRLEAAGLVEGRIDVSEDGKAMRFFEVTPFAITLTPALVAEAAASLRPEPSTEPDKEEEE